MPDEVRGGEPSLRQPVEVENQRFAAARAAGKTCFEIGDLGGCAICWGKGKWLGITDGDWQRAGRNAPRTVMSCPACRGTGVGPAKPFAGLRRLDAQAKRRASQAGRKDGSSLQKGQPNG